MQESGERRARVRHFDPRLGQILVLGALSGFPWVAIGSALSLWLRDLGISRTEVALLGGVGVAYAANLCWAPLLDRFRLPLLPAWLGQRKGWILLTQMVVVAALLAIATLANPGAGTAGLLAFGAMALVLALAGATADVCIDALRIELLGLDEARKVGLGAAMTTAGWWLSYGIFGGLVLIGVEALQQGGGGPDSWRWAYAAMAAVPLALTAVLLLWVREPQRDEQAAGVPDSATGPAASSPADETASHNPLLLAWEMYSAPVLSFAQRYGLRLALGILAVVVLFKSGEAFLGRMSIVFYDDLGFSKTDIAIYSKFTGTLITVASAFVGGLINARYGLLRGLILGGIAMASTNLLFSLMAVLGPLRWLLALTVAADQVTSALSTVTFVAFISQLCDRRHTATHYAALASLGNLSRTTLASGSGWTVDSLLGGSWFWFFVLTAVMVLPSLGLLWAMRGRLRPILAPQGAAGPQEPQGAGTPEGAERAKQAEQPGPAPPGGA